MKLSELKELAEKATPGKWECFFVFGSKDLPASVEVIKGTKLVEGIEVDDAIMVCDVGYGSDNAANDMRYIAAANPQVMLKLLERIEELERVKMKSEVKPNDFHVVPFLASIAFTTLVAFSLVFLAGCTTTNPAYRQVHHTQGNWTGMTHPDMH